MRNYLLALFILCFSNAYSIKSKNLPVDWGNPKYNETVNTRPDILEGEDGEMERVWRLFNGDATCNINQMEYLLYIYSNTALAKQQRLK